MKPSTAWRNRDSGSSHGYHPGWHGHPGPSPSAAPRHYRFRPGWVMTLLTLALFLLLLWLGFWQLSRAESKERLIAQFESSIDLPAVALDGGRVDGSWPIDHQVTVQGHFQDQPLLLLNNRFNKGRLGFHRLALLQLSGSERYLLVNRGWMPAASDGRPISREPIPPTSGQRLQGLLVEVPRGGLQMGELQYQPGQPVVELPYLDLSWLRQELGLKLLPRVLLQDEQVIAQYRKQHQAGWLNPQRHLGYALQWFALALALAVIYLVTNLKRSVPP